MREKRIYHGFYTAVGDERPRLMMSKNLTPFKDIAILGKDEAEELCKSEPNKWCAVSICMPNNESVIIYSGFELNNTKKISRHYFHDISSKRQGGVMCKEKDIKSILSFARECYGEALLVHCAAGISRSTATAFLIILDSIKDKVKNPVEEAITIVHTIRPIAYPNKHVLEIGMNIIARNKEELIDWWRELYNSKAWQKIRG